MTRSVNPLSLRLPTVRAAVRRVRYFLRGEHPGSYFDLHDMGAVTRLLADAGLPPLDGDPVRDGDAVRGATVYDLRDDVRRAIPLALTPAQRGAYLGWFLRYGRHETDADVLDVLGALAEQDATPDRGLVASYLVQPAWQEACPGALTPGGWAGFKAWLAAEYAVAGRWLRRAALPPRYAGPPPAAGFGANVIGLFRYPSGLQQAAATMVDALARAGVPTDLRDVPMRHTRTAEPRAGFLGLEPFPVTVLNTGLDIAVPDAYRLAGLHPRAGVYRVAVWWWELDRLPSEWLGRGRAVDEIWAPTAFIAGALRPLGKPVHLISPSVELPAFEPLPKAAFGLDPGRFTFLFVFDMNSRMARKNPLALVRAFRRTFRPDEPVELVIKVSPQEALWAENWRELRAATAAAGVKLIDRALSRGELLGLMNAADAYVSLHRSEGFGLTMAEAMLLGKPTAATGYAGNVDFMTAANSYLIDHSLVPITTPEVVAPPGAVWAEPSVEHAAAVMRKIVDHPDEARARGRRAQAELRVKLSHHAAGERMAARLRAIVGGRR
jgi:glycosyltransferase involved in cell wall biosynthesis